MKYERKTWSYGHALVLTVVQTIPAYLVGRDPLAEFFALFLVWVGGTFAYDCVLFSLSALHQRRNRHLLQLIATVAVHENEVGLGIKVGYANLAQLEELGLIASLEHRNGQKSYRLTPEGREAYDKQAIPGR